MAHPIDDRSLDQLFREGRSHGAWTDAPVTDEDLRAIYELTRLGPTSANSSPARFVWVRSEQGKARLRPHLSAVNADKVMKAPVTVIIGYDPGFARELPRLVTVPSPTLDVSRTHAEVRLEGEHVVVTDLESLNGVRVLRPGAPARRLHPGEPTVVAPGETVDLGDGVTFTVDRDA